MFTWRVCSWTCWRKSLMLNHYCLYTVTKHLLRVRLVGYGAPSVPAGTSRGWRQVEENESGVLLHSWAHSGGFLCPLAYRQVLILHSARLWQCSHSVLLVSVFGVTLMQIQIWICKRSQTTSKRRFGRCCAIKRLVLLAVLIYTSDQMHYFHLMHRKQTRPGTASFQYI